MTKSDDKRVPALRFKGFTDEWEQRKISEIYVKSTKKNDLSFAKNKVISVATMSWNKAPEKSSDSYMKTYNVMKKGDIAFEGHKNKKFMFGRFVENDLGDGIVSHIFDVYRPIYRDINITFWKYYINSEKVMHNVLRKSTTSATMMHNLVSKDFLNQTLLIPSNNESAKIGLIESKIDNLITLQQRKLELLKLMKSIISYNLVVSHKLTSNNKSEWKVAYLKDIAKIYQPTTITKKDLVPKGIPVFGANDYIGFYNTSNHTTDQVTICARGASAGNPNYVKAPVWITGNSMVINVDGVHINKKFLYTLLKFTNLKRFVTGGAQPQITRENLNSLKILLPSIEVQNSLSVLIEKLSINIKKTKTSIHSAKKLKQFLLQNMFI